MFFQFEPSYVAVYIEDSKMYQKRKRREEEDINIDNTIFKCHYIFTVIFLVLSSILLTSKIYFGEPIDCDVSLAQKSLINTLCWSNGTRLPQMPDGSVISYQKTDAFVSQTNYQWICISFLIQAFFCYIPYYIWKNCENKHLSLFVKDLENFPNDPESKKELVYKYFLDSDCNHKSYARKYAFCELLNFINIILQLSLLDWFLTGHFSIFDVASAIFKDIKWIESAFPKVMKCIYITIGVSGLSAKYDTHCALPMNFFNEKLFLCLWVWFFFLSILSFYQLIYRLLIFSSRSLRNCLLRFKNVEKRIVSSIVNDLSFGDFFFINLVSKNIERPKFKQLLYELVNVTSSTKDYQELSETEGTNGAFKTGEFRELPESV